MIRVLYLAIWFSFFPALSADAPPAQKGGPEKEANKEGPEKITPKSTDKTSERVRGPAVKARPAGVAIEHSGLSLAEADRSPEGELRAILAATAILKVDRPLHYRTMVLAPGSYPVTISGEGQEGTGRNLFFVIGPAAGSATAGAVTPEEKKQEKSIETSPPARSEKPGEPKGSGRRSAAKTVPGQIRALFHLTAAKEAASRVEFTVRPSARGDKFTLMVKAGASQGKATLRLGE